MLPLIIERISFFSVIVVRRRRVFAHVHRREAPRAIAVRRQAGRRERHAVEELQTLAVVHPVRLGGEIPHVHARPSGRDVGRSRLGVLAGHPVPGGEVRLEDLVVCPERVQLRPAIEVLECVVGPVVGSPTQEGLEITACVVVFREELAACGDVVGKKLALEPRPAGRRHRRIDDDRGGRCGEQRHGDKQRDESPARHERTASRRYEVCSMRPTE